MRAGANSAEDEMRAGTRFTVSPFDWSCLSFRLGVLSVVLVYAVVLLLFACLSTHKTIP